MLFRFLARAGRIASNPAHYWELPRAEKPLPNPALTRDEVERVLAQPDINTAHGLRDRAILETLFATGIRRLELVRLQVGDIDMLAHTLRVRRGKGKRGRVVPISDRAVSWISRYLAVRPKPSNDQDADVLFLTKRGEMCGSVDLTRRARDYVRAAGIGKTGSCHIFRATTATLMLESGADIRFVQEMLGHAKITTTQIYTRVSISALQRVYERTHPSAEAIQQIVKLPA
jgi:integrase/recombinase XerD